MWPALFNRVVASLRRRGVDLASAEDAAQEAGARALACQVAYASEDDLCRWLHTVARRVAIDARRRTARCSGEVVELPAAVDVAAEVESRFRLHVVGRVLPMLSATDRAALLEEAPPATSRQESVKLAVRRHRARTRLTALMEGLAGAILIPWRRAWRALVPTTALAVAVFAPLAFVLLPRLEPGTRADDAAAQPNVRVVGLMPASLVDADVALLPARAHVAARPAAVVDPTAPGRAPAGPVVVAPIPSGPGTARGEFTIEPKEPDESIACAGNPTVGRVCTPDPDARRPLTMPDALPI